jgi:hypothetical protein
MDQDPAFPVSVYTAKYPTRVALAASAVMGGTVVILSLEKTQILTSASGKFESD